MKTNNKIDRIQTNEVLLNGTVVAKGTVTCSLVSKLEPDSSGEPSQIITIEGIMETGYYIADLETIETNRYYLEGVSVYEENYTSVENKIKYHFSASLFQVKFQDVGDQYYTVEKG